MLKAQENVVPGDLIAVDLCDASVGKSSGSGTAQQASHIAFYQKLFISFVGGIQLISKFEMEIQKKSATPRGQQPKTTLARRFFNELSLKKSTLSHETKEVL